MMRRLLLAATALSAFLGSFLGCRGDGLPAGPAAPTTPPADASWWDGYTPDGPEVALIIVSPSTNTPAVEVVVDQDDSAIRRVGPTASSGATTFSYLPGSYDVSRFLADLAAVGDVAAISTGNECGKSISFGTTTTVLAYGYVSGDLQCLTDPTAAEKSLVQDCRTLTGDAF